MSMLHKDPLTNHIKNVSTLIDISLAQLLRNKATQSLSFDLNLFGISVSLYTIFVSTKIRRDKNNRFNYNARIERDFLNCLAAERRFRSMGTSE